MSSNITNAFKAVCDKILGKDADNHGVRCCMCLNPADEGAISINDKISINFHPKNEVLTELLMSRVIVNLVGESAVDIMKVFQMVCRKCALDAINALKFIQRSKDSIEALERALGDLENCFEDVSDMNYESLYVYVNLQNMTIQQFYDIKKQNDPENTALARFHFIAKGLPIKKPSETETKRRPKDYSTIFIKTHELIADPSKPKEYKCKMCLKLFPFSGNLRQHFFATHFKKEFSCPDCKKSFGTAGLLQSHMQISHQLVECSDCGKKLLNRTSTLKRHAMSHLKSTKICQRCGKTYKKVNDFEKHIARDTCEVPSRIPGNFICDMCGYHSLYKSQLQAHIKYEHSGAHGHICKWCNKKCYTASALKTHILKHTKERNYACSICGGKFVTKQSLTNHFRLHTGERPYQCDRCDLSFLSASRRKDHIERYHSGSSYQCDLCPAKFSARRSLVKHRKRHFEIETIVS